MKRLYIALLAAAAAALGLLLPEGAPRYALWGLCAAAAAAALFLPRRRPSAPTDPDPDGTRFTAQLTEMMDTISRATAERECGISTQLLYEQARFCEPCADPSVRETERSILTAITQMHPDDPDEVITQKCEAVQRLLDKREKGIKTLTAP